MALSENSTVKMGLGSVSVVLKDKQPEVRKDENLVTEKINAIPSTLNSEQKAQGLPYTTTHASKSVTSRPVEAFSLKVEENGHLPLSSRTGDVGDGRQSCLFDSKTSNDSKRPCSDNDSASMESKQRLHRTLSPALAALIERDAKNSQTYSKNEVGKRETCGKVSEDSSAPVLGVACTKKDEPLNSWDAFELKLQNKILKSTDKRLLGSDARGRHEGTFASKHEENEKISFRGISSADLEKDKLEGKLSPGKHEPTSNDENYEDKRNSKKKVGVQNEVLTPSITARTRSFLGLKESEKPEEKNTEMKSTLGKEDSTGRETIHSFSSRDGSKNVVFEEVGAVNNLHLDKGLNTTENFTSFSLGSDSLAVVVDKGDSNKKSLSDKEVSIGKQHSDTNQRITSFSLTADPKNSAVEDGTFENSSSSTKDDSDTRQRVSSFSLRGDSETRIVDNAARKINQTTSGTKNLAQEKGSNCIPERPPCDKTLDSSIQEDLVQVDGHTIPKTLAVLLAKDGTSPEKKEEGSENDDCNVFKNKLKELKKTGPRSGVSLVVTCPKNGAQSNVELPQSTSDGKVDDVSYNKVIYRLKNDHEEVEKDTAHDNEGCTEKLPSNSPLSKPSVIEDDISSSQRSKAIAEEKNTGRDFSGNAKKRTVDDVSVSIRIPGNKPLMSQGNSPESSSMDYTVPRLNHKPDSSYNSVSMPTVASRTGLPSQPHSLGISPTSKSSPIASDAVSPSQLRKELEKSRKDLEESKRTYENKITELQLQIDFLRRQKSGQIDVNGNFLESSASISDLTSLYSSFSTPVVSPGNSNVTSPSPTPCVTPKESTPDEYVAFSPRSPPPPPPAPPSVPSLPTANGSHVKPTKPVVNPRTDMKPLFWNRIITSNGESSGLNNQTLLIPNYNSCTLMEIGLVWL